MAFISDQQWAVLGAFRLYSYLMDKRIEDLQDISGGDPESSVKIGDVLEMIENDELAFRNVLDGLGYTTLEDAKESVSEHFDDFHYQDLGTYELFPHIPTDFDARVTYWVLT